MGLSLLFLCFLSFSTATEHGVSTDVNTLIFYYFSSTNAPVEIIYENLDSLNSSGLLHSAPTTLIIDGFLSLYPTNMSRALIESLPLDEGNVLVLDWGSMSGGRSPLLDGNFTEAMEILYPLALANMPRVGQRLAEFLEFICSHGQIPAVHIIGHSWGAHVAGIAGKVLHAAGSHFIGRITGLDPTNSELLPPSVVIQKTDAELVDIYYTNTGVLGDTRSDAGDLVVYVNGGDDQPGCIPGQEWIPGYCSHSYSWKFYSGTVSVKRWGCPCSTTSPADGASCYCKINCDDCGRNRASLGYIVDDGTNGLYHVTVSDRNGGGLVQSAAVIQSIVCIVTGILLW